MLDVAQLFGSGDGHFERVFCALAGDVKASLRLERVERNLVLFVGGTGVIALLRHTGDEDDEGDEATLARQLDELKTLAKDQRLEVAMIGGSPKARRLLEKAASASELNAFHLPNPGFDLWQNAEGGTLLGYTLTDAAEDRLPRPDWPKVQAELNREQREQQEVEQSTRVLQSRKPYVTWALLAVILAMFLLELSVGGDFSAHAMIELGAITRELVRRGEYYRLISAGFLHFGPAHLLMNCFVLARLGGAFERLIGPSRFLILYALSLLGGSLGAVLFQGHGASAGASGALWGILGAQAVLAYRPAGVIPDGVANGMKKVALQNLALNVAISLVPGIGWAAHFGGGITGALLTASGVITSGVTKGRTPIVLKLIASTCAALMLAGVAAAVGSRERAAQINNVEWKRVDAPELGISHELPAALAKDDRTSKPHRVVYGDLQRDPVEIAVSSTTTADYRVTVEHLKRNLKKPVEGARQSEAEQVWLGDRPAVHDRVIYKNGVIVDRWLRLEVNAVHRIEVLMVPAYEERYRHAADRIAASIKTLPNASP